MCSAHPTYHLNHKRNDILADLPPTRIRPVRGHPEEVCYADQAGRHPWPRRNRIRVRSASPTSASCYPGSLIIRKAAEGLQCRDKDRTAGHAGEAHIGAGGAANAEPGR